MVVSLYLLFAELELLSNAFKNVGKRVTPQQPCPFEIVLKCFQDIRLTKAIHLATTLENATWTLSFHWTSGKNRATSQKETKTKANKRWVDQQQYAKGHTEAKKSLDLLFWPTLSNTWHRTFRLYYRSFVLHCVRSLLLLIGYRMNTT